jgi:hypothetical protein
MRVPVIHVERFFTLTQIMLMQASANSNQMNVLTQIFTRNPNMSSKTLHFICIYL